MARWVRRAPLGAPVVPVVKTIRATSSGSGARPPISPVADEQNASQAENVTTSRRAGSDGRTDDTTLITSAPRWASTQNTPAAPDDART